MTMMHNPAHPGEVLREWIPEDMTVGQAAEADAVILTCATLGPAVDELEHAAVPIVRADRALAAAATKAGRRIAVLCAVESSLNPNRQLFEEHVSDRGATIKIVHVTSVWALYQGGCLDSCYAAIAAAADKAYDAGATVVALAHPWMAPAANLVRGKRRPLHSADAALRAVMER